MAIVNEGIYTLVQNGLVEIIIFSLVFAVVFGILRNVALFAKKDDKESLRKVKPVHTIISLVLAALTILPHYVSRYSAYDIVPIVEQSFPKISLIALAIIGILVVLGLFGMKIAGGSNRNPVKSLIFVVVIGLIIWIFGGTLTAWRLPYWLTPDLVAVVIAILVFGLVVSFIMGPEKKRDSSIEKATKNGKVDWSKVKYKDIINDVLQDANKKN